MSSEHVVVKRELLESVLQDWIQFGCLTTPTCEGVQAAIDSTSPEMVPMEEVEKILEDTEQYLRDNIPTTSWGLLDKPADRDREVLLDALATFNAKFKP